MNKKHYLFLLSSSILCGMDKGSGKEVRFTTEDMAKAASAQEAILANISPISGSPESNIQISPPAIPRTKLNPNEKYPTKPQLSPNKNPISAPRDSAPDIYDDRIRNLRRPPNPDLKKSA